MDAVDIQVVVTLVIAALVVSMKIFLSCSNSWGFLDGSVAFHLLSLMISSSSFLFLSYLCLIIPWLDLCGGADFGKK